MTDLLRTEYTAREFNRDPSAISRAAHKFGLVHITNRGRPSLIVADADRHPELAEPKEGRSLLEALSFDAPWDEDVIGEPERISIILRDVDDDEDEA
ncbi:MAG: hypothetical protein FWF75_04460 [Propionibacteriaceae bacterium]|nr:hypothetical protein [Propionibacteriaceae bacterium]